MSATLQVAVAVIKNANGEVFISLRHNNLHQGGLWEFPGGKVEPGETTVQALRREIKEELATDIETATPLINIKHHYPDRSVQLHVFLVENFSGEAQHRQGQQWQWVAPEKLRQYNFPAANQPIITAAYLPPYYAILDDGDALLDKLKALLAQGIKLIQARLKRLPATSVEAFCEQAYPLCRQQGTILLLNSAAAWKGSTSVDGLHLTSQHLMALTERPAHYRWLAASCHNGSELQHAQTIGVDFAVLAPVLPTQTHEGATPLGWEKFRHLTTEATIPVYALGGLQKTDLAIAQQAGAQGIAAIRAFTSHFL